MSNLPPGVHVGMIPGNRPEDEWWERFTDKIIVPDDMVGATDPEEVARTVNVYLDAINAFYVGGFKEGKQEAEMTPFPQRCSAYNRSDHRQCDREKGHPGFHLSMSQGEVHSEVWWDDE